ncbi:MULTISPECIES: hypothetical protein [Delftia]|uniref:Uncharacterized protein n=1 Tax=Delftia acidovorans TaxID=80866 RepID=A0AAJ2VDZ4_DELAC|nr:MULTISPECIES: hypothetical protein [Delftia]KZK31534.1 hypothetical protein A4F85_02005 [Delftia sp. GW456-R20]MDX4958097.1 hypothetical protein [Delftia acidovorans]
MPTYSYRPYYSDKITSHEQFMQDELSEDEAAQVIEQLPFDLEHHFEEGEAEITCIGGILRVTTDVPENECHHRVKQCLISRNLRADKLPSNSV